jgi:hypothetical protein
MNHLSSLLFSASILLASYSLVNAQYQPLTYDQMKNCMTQINIEEEIDEQSEKKAKKLLPGEGRDFKVFVVKQKGNPIGRLITLEAGGNGYFDLVLADGDHPSSFFHMATHYQETHQGKANLFQAFTLVEEGVSQNFRDRALFSRRALVERDYINARGIHQRGWAVFNLDIGMTNTDLGILLNTCMGVRNAVLLNTGSHEQGWLKYADGTELLLITEHQDFPPFTTLLFGVVNQP